MACQGEFLQPDDKAGRQRGGKLSKQKRRGLNSR